MYIYLRAVTDADDDDDGRHSTTTRATYRQQSDIARHANSHQRFKWSEKGEGRGSSFSYRHWM